MSGKATSTTTGAPAAGTTQNRADKPNPATNAPAANKAATDNRANQMNPNNPATKGGSGGVGGTGGGDRSGKK